MGDIGKPHKRRDPDLAGTRTGDAYPQDGGLVASLVMASYDQYSATSRQLIKSLQKEAARQRAEKELIQDLVTDLLSGRYAPSHISILQALHPDSEAIERRAAELLLREHHVNQAEAEEKSNEE